MKARWSVVVAMMAVAAPAGAQGQTPPDAVPQADRRPAPVEQDLKREQKQQQMWMAQARDSVKTAAGAAIERDFAQQLKLATAFVQGKITRGAPYSADTVTESVQALADGNRIVNRTTTRVYRDGEGRTRTEHVSANNEITSIAISDPVQGVSYVLDPQTRTASESTVIVSFTMAKGADTTAVTVAQDVQILQEKRAQEYLVQQKREQERQAGAAAGMGAAGGVVRIDEGVASPKVRADVEKEDLGQQVIGGVVANGSRVTTTIPAGQIGNEQPIRIVSEQWFSPDLQVLLLTRYSDPRTGETTYRVNNVIRNEPAANLFQVPADYTMRKSVIRKESLR